MSQSPSTELYLCDHCGRAECRRCPSPATGTADDSARAAGWRIGATPAKPRNVICPTCADTDPGYWDRRTLATAHAAGLHAGGDR